MGRRKNWEVIRDELDESYSVSFRRRRKNLGISIRELAKRASMSYTHLCNLENGHHSWTNKGIAKISEALRKAEQ